ncbi:MAG TPA: hypothetical protein VK302_12480 [Terriglobales bacterium]|nr:hypothetical protein [Terriglobales bacterium]
MKSRPKRLKAIELSLTPKQIVVVWLRNTLQAGTFENAARRDTVRNSMKGQPEPLIERAILQARQEADLLYQFVLNANLAVLEDRGQREREYIFLLGYLSAEARGNLTKDRIDHMRLAFLMFIEPVIMLDAAIAQVVAEQLDGQPILFRDCEVKLEEQLQMVEALSKHFNLLADALDIVEINLEELRSSLQSQIERQVSSWASMGRASMLGLFGTIEEMHVAMDQGFRLCRAEIR